MKRRSLRAYFVLGCVLATLLILPENSVCALRSKCLGLAIPFSHIMSSMPSSALQQKFDTLCLENTVLENQVSRAYSWLAQEAHLDLCIDGAKKAEYLQGKVIFREPMIWNQCLWVDLGAEDNRRVHKEIIAVDSPVVSGSNLVGVVDYVGEKRSRIKLITNAALAPSVRAVRGGMQKRYLLEHLDPLIRGLDLVKDLQTSDLMTQLKELKDQLVVAEETHFLAKGQVLGMSEPLWGSVRPRLKGIGFHYGVEDDKGAPRDLISGQPLSGQGLPLELIRQGDLLVTTGFDGVFPEGLKVGMVSKVCAADPGDPTYAIEVDLLLSNFTDLIFVQILAPTTSSSSFQ